MGDGTKSKPTTGETEPLPGTVQLRPGMIPDPPPAVMSTVVPTSSTQAGGPPPMPADWRYAMKSEIARGGMGRVVEATDTVLGRTVALKEALSVDPDAIKRFQRETRITARLEHPSIVPVHDAGTSPNGSPFYVMRKVSGRPLEELVGLHSALPERLALLPHIVAAANAVAHAHERGIIHRDIKPANILVGDLGETIVIDWGLAKAIGEPDDQHATIVSPDDTDVVKTRAGVVFGTPGFMAPEQLRGAPADERCDVYALGATLYHLLARRPPHHAKTADDMMRAAVDGPPQPLREILPGVPPELATIVDKALAHAPEERYQNAGALAEDLQRFLAGQLVASHHYSTRERVLRFVRKNRALVGVTCAATAALAIGGTLAIHRIVGERDRADHQAQIALQEKQEAERRRAEVADKLAQLTLKDARVMASSDPTLAVAMVQPLITALHWRDVRSIAGEARAHGVAFGLVASPHTLSLEMSHDGQRALAAGDDGQIRLYDLAHRTSRTVADAKGPARARFADGERTFVVFHDRLVTIVDAASGAHRDVLAGTTIDKLEVSGPIAFWTDQDRAVWRLDLAGGNAQKLELDEQVAQVAPSPDGRWIALAGNAHLLLVDRTQPTMPPEVLADGETRDVSWAADAGHLVALVDQEVVDITMVPSPTMVRRVTVGNRSAVAFSDGQLFTAGPTGVMAVGSREEARVRKIAGDYTLGLREARGGVVVTASAQGAIAVLDDDGEHVIQSPVTQIAHLAASPRAPFVVAAGDGRLLVWDLDAVEPHHATAAQPSGARFVTDDAVIATFVDGPAQWIDLRTNKATPLGPIAGLVAVAPSPDATRALVIDGTHHGSIVAPVGESIEIPGDLEQAAFVDDKRFVTATSAGAIVLDEGERGHTATLAHHAAGVVALAARPGWVAAAFGDRVLWRTNLGSGEAALDVAAPPPRGAFALAADGTVVFALGSEIHAWRPDGSNANLGALGKPVVALELFDEGRVLAIAGDGSAKLVGLEHGTDADAVVPPGASFGHDLAAVLTANGALDIVDPIAHQSWTLAPSKAQAISFAQISPGDGRVLAVTPNGLLVWALSPPHGPDDTARWLDSITNATVTGDPTAPLGWR